MTSPTPAGGRRGSERFSASTPGRSLSRRIRTTARRASASWATRCARTSTATRSGSPTISPTSRPTGVQCTPGSCTSTAPTPTRTSTWRRWRPSRTWARPCPGSSERAERKALPLQELGGDGNSNGRTLTNDRTAIRHVERERERERESYISYSYTMLAVTRWILRRFFSVDCFVRFFVGFFCFCFVVGFLLET